MAAFEKKIRKSVMAAADFAAAKEVGGRGWSGVDAAMAEEE